MRLSDNRIFARLSFSRNLPRSVYILIHLVVVSLFNNSSKKKNAGVHGFTLVELLISVAIIMILSIALYVQQNKFDGAIFIQNTAQQIALSVREAQTYTAGSVNVGGQSGRAYGIHFVRNSAEVVFFMDTQTNNPDGRYTASNDLMIRTYTLRSPNNISQLRVGGNDCASLTITFKRPNPEPIHRCGNGGLIHGSTSEITLQVASDGTTKMISVAPTGQIQVQ